MLFDDILCDPRDALTFDEDPVASTRIDEAASRLRRKFHSMAISILGRKEQDERERERKVLLF